MPPKHSDVDSLSANNSNLSAPQGTSHDHAAAIARQLVLDMEALKKRRQQLEHQIKVRDVAVFAMETSYLQMTSTPMCATTDPVFAVMTAAGAGKIRPREAANNDDDDNNRNQAPMFHLGAIQLGDKVSDESLPRGVALNDRMFSLSNFTALSTCGKSGLIE